MCHTYRTFKLLRFFIGQENVGTGQDESSRAQQHENDCPTPMSDLLGFVSKLLFHFGNFGSCTIITHVRCTAHGHNTSMTTCTGQGDLASLVVLWVILIVMMTTISKIVFVVNGMISNPSIIAIALSVYKKDAVIVGQIQRDLVVVHHYIENRPRKKDTRAESKLQQS